MYSLEQIIAMNNKKVEKAEKNNIEPYIAVSDEDEGVFSCPNIGSAKLKGWKEVETYFVDSSGFGSESEPALTPSQFVAKVKEGYGYAIVSEGQFQVYVGEFKKEE